MLPHQFIQQRLRDAIVTELPDADVSTVEVKPCDDPKFGDYQASALMGLAKARKLNPRTLATQVSHRLDVSEMCSAVEIAGAGFLNFRLRPEAFRAALVAAARGEHLFFARSTAPRKVVVDFSSPNVAKPMHVGHIRSTILGDALARTLRLLGHTVITDNHLGDWGTQFGMLIVGWKTLLDPAALQNDPIAEMERIYQIISARCDPEKPGYDGPTHDRARAELVKLQGGDPENLQIWRDMKQLSQGQFDTIYGRLGVCFDHTLGESHYNPRLSEVVADLERAGLARESRGAKAIFSEGKLPPKEDPFLVHREGEWAPNPFIVLKQDGGYNYATSDLATLLLRVDEWHADEILYVTDGRQQLHFQQLFSSFRRWRPQAQVQLEHVWFGSILGQDGKPFKTRSGETVKLADLLDEAEERAYSLVTERSPVLPEAQRREIARVVGIGAVKYADLLPNRQSDYVFAWEKLLALQGNTAPYLQYAYARIRSIFHKGEVKASDLNPDALNLQAPEEMALARQLLRFGFALEAVATDFRPNWQCNYLYELGGRFTSFYENCPVLKSEGPVRASRLVLCDLAARVLKQGLETLGIETLDSM